MAMFERRDRSAYYGSLSSNTQAAQQRASVKNIRSSTENSTVLARRGIQRREAERRSILDTESIGNFISKASSLFSSAVSGGMKLSELIAASESEEASVDMAEWLAEGDKAADDAIRGGEAGFKENEQPSDESPSGDAGNQGASVGADPETVSAGGSPARKSRSYSFDPGESFTTWYEGLLDRIENSDYSATTKESMRKQATQYYVSKFGEMAGMSIEQTYYDYENAFSANQQIAAVPDSQLWAQYNGTLPAGVMYQGIANIAGRSDWSDERKQTEAALYLEQVRYSGAKERAVQIARTEGLASADSYLQSLSFLSADQRNSIYGVAQTSYGQMEGAYVSQAEDIMAEAFTDMGTAPAEVMQEINDIGKANNLPKSMVSSMLRAAQGQQRTAVRTMVSNQLSADAAGGYSAYAETLDWLESGRMDSWFYGMPEEKDAAIAQYKAKLQDIEESAAKALDTSAEKVRSADNDVITAFEDGLDSDWNLFTSGSYTGEEYLQAVTNRTAAARKQIGLPESDASILAAQSVAMNKVMGYIPQALRGDIESAVTSLLVAEKLIQSQASKRSPEELALLNKVLTQTNGAIADAIFQYGTKAVGTPEDIFNYANQTTQAFILQNEVLGTDGLSDIPLLDEPGVTMKKAVTAAVESNNKIVNAGESNYIYLDHSAGYDPVGLQDEDGNTVGVVSRYLASGELAAFPEYRFLSIEAQEDFRRRTDVFESLLLHGMNQDGMSITKADIHSMPEVSDSGNTAIASPVMFVDGRIFRVRANEIQETKDGETWTAFATFTDSGDVSLVNPQEREVRIPDNNWLDANTIGRYVKPAYETTRAGRQLTGVTIDPAIFETANYSQTDAINLVKNDPELKQAWQIFAREINAMDTKEDN